MARKTLEDMFAENYFGDDDDDLDLPESVNDDIKHLPVVLLIDVSSSMDGSPIQHVNTYLQKFFSDVSAGCDASYARVRDAGDFCVITYGSDSNVVLDWTHGSDLSANSVPTLKAYGMTAMHGAIMLAGNKLLDRLRGYRRDHVEAYCGLVFNLTDGAPSDDAKAADAKKVIDFYEHASSSGEAYVRFYHVGVPGFSRGPLEALSTKPDRVFDMQNTDMARFFDFIAATLGSLSGDEDLVLDLANRYLR